MYALLNLIATLISLYMWVLIVSVITSWLIAFNVINTRNQFVYQVMHVLSALTEPVLRPIRRVIPIIGGIDFSPLILILLLVFLRNLVLYDLPRALL
jgi:YggT family protein